MKFLLYFISIFLIQCIKSLYIFFFFVETGLEKETIKGNAVRTSRLSEDNEIKYETIFEVPVDFGEIGAVLVENKHHKEMYLKDMVLQGFPNGPINIICRSWVHSKFQNPAKRVFFTSKVSILPDLLFFFCF